MNKDPKQKSKRRIAVVTDSACDLPPPLLAEFDIQVVPLILMMEGESWRDRVDIQPPAFYELLEKASSFPTTSQPSAAVFKERFVQLAQEVEGIVAVLVAQELSGTVASAQSAAAELPDIPIEIVDSRAVSMMLGYTVLAAAEAAAAGGDLQEVAAAANSRIGKTGVYFVVGTLDYLHRSGRIGAAARLVGSALNLKPILNIQDGTVTPIAKVRTRRKALERVYHLLEGRLAGEERFQMTVVQVAAPEEAAEVKDALQSRFRPVTLTETECSPVIGAHVGPGTVGVAFNIA